MAGAYETPGLQITLPASAALATAVGAGTAQFHFVDVDSSGNAVLAGNAGRIVGVLQNKPANAGDPATVMVNGVSKVVNGTAGLAAGAQVMSDADGEAILAATAGSETAGVALKAAAAVNELVPVLIQPGFVL